MAYDYNDAAAIVQRAMDKYGGPGQAIQKGSTGGRDAFGNVTPDTPDVTIDGTISPLVKYKRDEVDGTSIQNGDAWVYFISATKPSINMQVTLNGLTFRIKGIKSLTSVDDINIYTKLQLRK